MSLQEKLAEHRVMAAQLKELKADEMALRKEICEELLIDKPVGTHKFDIEGFSVSVSRNLTYKLDLDELAVRMHDFSDEEKDCIEYKATFSKTKYNKLVEKDELDECLIVTDAAPTLKITMAGEDG